MLHQYFVGGQGTDLHLHLHLRARPKTLAAASKVCLEADPAEFSAVSFWVFWRSTEERNLWVPTSPKSLLQLEKSSQPMIHAGWTFAEISVSIWLLREIKNISWENSPAHLQAEDLYCSLKKLWLSEPGSYCGSLQADSCCRDLVSNWVSEEAESARLRKLFTHFQTQVKELENHIVLGHWQMVVDFVQRPVRKQRPEKYMIASWKICRKFGLGIMPTCLKGFDIIMRLISLL